MSDDAVNRGRDEAGDPGASWDGDDRSGGRVPGAAASPGRSRSGGRSPATGMHAAVAPPPVGWRGLRRVLRPRRSASQVLVGVLCAILGFALVVQLGQNNRDPFASLRQGDLVRSLDEVTGRASELEGQLVELRATRDDLMAGAERQRIVAEAAREEAEVQGILSGRMPARGPGVTIDITADAPLTAGVLVNLLEELRNAGAEVMEVNGVRLVASSHFTDIGGDLRVDGTALTSPISWVAIGDPDTIETALQINGGAVDALERVHARASITKHDEVRVTATVEVTEPTYATPRR